MRSTRRITSRILETSLGKRCVGCAGKQKNFSLKKRRINLIESYRRNAIEGQVVRSILEYLKQIMEDVNATTYHQMNGKLKTGKNGERLQTNLMQSRK